jgi:hypothetical protein
MKQANILSEAIKSLIQDAYRELERTPMEQGTRRLEILTRIDTLNEVLRLKSSIDLFDYETEKTLLSLGIKNSKN